MTQKEKESAIKDLQDKKQLILNELNELSQEKAGFMKSTPLKNQDIQKAIEPLQKELDELNSRFAESVKNVALKERELSDAHSELSSLMFIQAKG